MNSLNPLEAGKVKPPDKGLSAGAIHIRGARQNNLKKIDVDIHLGCLTVICGPSGSGKSSLAFETLFSEGQRRYTETLSNYARQYIKEASKPLVESIQNIPPPILLGQKNNIRSSRSTVGTHSEVMDHLRVIFSKAGKIICPKHKIPLKKYSPAEAAKEASQNFKKGFLLFPIETIDKKNHSQLILQLSQDGFSRIGRLKNKKLNIQRLSETRRLPKAPFYVVVDRLDFSERERASGSIAQCYSSSVKYNPSFTAGKALLFSSDEHLFFFTENQTCLRCCFAFPLPMSPALFSFNSPLGACEACKGFGNILTIDESKVAPNPFLTIAEGVISVFSTPSTAFERRQLLAFCKDKKIDIHTPWIYLKKTAKQTLWRGDKKFFGVEGFFKFLENQKYKMHVRVFLSRYKSPKVCGVCRGGRLRKEIRLVRFQGMDIVEWSQLNFEKLGEKLNHLEFSSNDSSSALLIQEAVSALKRKVMFINQIGLSYLQLNRPLRSLSGGELQRLNLASQLGMGFSQILYILDEPTIGLHSQDSQKLIQILKNLQNHGNTVVVIEHDVEVIEQAQRIIEMGPGSGLSGGEIIFNGSASSFFREKKSLTAKALCSAGRTAKQKRETHPKTFKYFLSLYDCTAHNLKKINLKIPLLRLVLCSGVSGSGKSSLAVQTLYPALKKALAFENNTSPRKNTAPLKLADFLKDLPLSRLEGFERIKRVVMIDQSSAEKTVRSLVATYIGIFTPIRKIMADISLARDKKHLMPGEFSLNVDGGRCPACRGLGYQEIEMIFMDPVKILCEVCRGLKFQPYILDIQWNKKNIHQILQMTVSEALGFFASYPVIFSSLILLKKVGLDYLPLGQSLSALSGGESQRLKLAREMTDPRINQTFYILDEPSTGLHFKEVNLLVQVLHQLVDQGGSVFVVEHNLQMISQADYIIDLGPEAGKKGGRIVAQSPLLEFIKKNQGATAKCLRKYLNH